MVVRGDGNGMVEEEEGDWMAIWGEDNWDDTAEEEAEEVEIDGGVSLR